MQTARPDYVLAETLRGSEDSTHVESDEQPGVVS